MKRIEGTKALARAFRSGRAASASIVGGDGYSEIHGTADFYQTEYGVVVVWEIYGLPFDNEKGAGRIFACHIHEGKSCTGGDSDGFSGAMGHYNPLGLEHPNHAGDLPPLLACLDNAYLSVKTDRFSVNEIIGRTVVIHSDPDDFHSLPAGNAGMKIGCGVIYKRR